MPRRATSQLVNDLPAGPRWKLPPGVAALPFWTLVAANLVPLVGVIAFDWDLRSVMVLYWAENVVVGLYALARMGVVAGAVAIPAGAFFVVHFGLFMFVHLIFVITLTNPGGGFGAERLPPPKDFALADIPWIGVAALVVSHGVSFVREFLQKGEWRKSNLRAEMSRPYPRMAVMHIAIIAGAFFFAMLGQPVALLVVLIVLKTALDATAHIVDHRIRQNTREEGP